MSAWPRSASRRLARSAKRSRADGEAGGDTRAVWLTPRAVGAPVWQATAEQIERAQGQRSGAAGTATRTATRRASPRRSSAGSIRRSPAAFWEPSGRSRTLRDDGARTRAHRPRARRSRGRASSPRRGNSRGGRLREHRRRGRADRPSRGSPRGASGTGHALTRGTARARRGCASAARGRAIASRPCSRIGPHASAAMLAGASVEPVWTRARPTSARAACSIASARSSRWCFSRPTADFYNGRAHDVCRGSPRCARRCRACADRAGSVGRRRRGPRRTAPRLGRRARARTRAPRSRSSGCRSITRSTCSTRAARPAPPRCIVHGAGGMCSSTRRNSAARRPAHARAPVLLHDLRLDDVELARVGARRGATPVLYDGSPSHRELGACSIEPGASAWPSSARRRSSDRLRWPNSGSGSASAGSCARARILSTGLAALARWLRLIYRARALHAQVASISGGTDIVSCLVLGLPVARVWRGEIQMPGLGLAVDVSTSRPSARASGKGGMSCTRAVPVDADRILERPRGSRHRSAFFERFQGVWRHGDCAEWTPHGGMRIHGRADAI